VIYNQVFRRAYTALLFHMDLIKYFEKKALLTDGKSNTKTAKNSMHTYYLSLQPTNLNSKKENLCKFSTKECRTACLQFAGRQSFSNVVESRSRKTEFFVNHKTVFVRRLWTELGVLDRKGERIAVRLNLLSDVDWQAEFTRVMGNDAKMDSLKNIQFYDYTKDHFKIYGTNPKNYNLTFSFSGHNWNHAEHFLKNKLANVAVVFKKEVPSQWKGFTVVNGDTSDERFLDQKGVIVGLKYKTPKGVKYEKTKFVVDD
jgi:hypothetical protein